MKTLITTEPDDIHAVFAKLALEDLGHDCKLWFTADMPTQQTNSLFFLNEEFSWLFEDCNDNSKKIMSNPFDVVWWRRARRPFVPATVHENDFDAVKKENLVLHEAIPLVLANDAWWVNPYESLKYANSKVYQLKLASSCGFNIPPTLISNSPEEIKKFIKNNNKNPVIYKPFSPINWHENDVLKFSYTNDVEVQHLPTDEVLQMTPGIFQHQLKKKYELRVTCFGEHIVAVKINSQQHSKARTDWRRAPTQELKLEPYILPPAIETTIRTFMNKLGIVFGCFDFIVTPNDEIYFLEVNQQGQFLWIEELLPEVQLLDMFVQFVINKTVHFKWNKSVNSIRSKDYEQRASQLLDLNISQHVYLNEIKKQSVAS